MTQCLDHLSDKELKAAVRSLKGRKKAVAREALSDLRTLVARAG
jgi:hypothetical protein